MPKPKLTDKELLDHLVDVFRTYGFEGASLSRITEATGLQRASLYHRFPGGKEEMAAAVLSHASQQLGENALSRLEGTTDPAARVRLMAQSLREFYEGGQKSCLLDSLSFSDSSETIHQQVAGAMSFWSKKLEEVAKSSGLSPRAAQRWSEDSLVRIHGALVVARATANCAIFDRILDDLPASLKGASAG